MANGAIPVTSLAKDAEPVRVLTTDGGHVAPARRRPVAPRNGRGLAAADFDNDGDLDLAVGSIGGAVQLLRNDGGSQAGHWLEVSLRRFAPGAVVTAVLPDGRRLVQAAHAGLELPLLRGPPAPLRPRQGDARGRARRPLPRRSRDEAPRRRRRQDRQRRVVDTSFGVRLKVGHQPPYRPQPGSRPAAPRVSRTTSMSRFDERTCSRASVRAAWALPAEIASRIARCWRSFFA